MIVCEKLAPVHVPYKCPHVARKFPKSSRSIVRGLPRLSGGPEHNKTVHGPRCAVCGLTCGRFVCVNLLLLGMDCPNDKICPGDKSRLFGHGVRFANRAVQTTGHGTRCAVRLPPFPGGGRGPVVLVYSGQKKARAWRACEAVKTTRSTRPPRPE